MLATIRALTSHWIVTFYLLICLPTKLRAPYTVSHVFVLLNQIWLKVGIQLIFVEFIPINAFLTFNFVISLLTAAWQIYFLYFLFSFYSLSHSSQFFIQTFPVPCTVHFSTSIFEEFGSYFIKAVYITYMSFLNFPLSCFYPILYHITIHHERKWEGSWGPFSSLTTLSLCFLTCLDSLPAKQHRLKGSLLPWIL